MKVIMVRISVKFLVFLNDFFFYFITFNQLFYNFLFHLLVWSKNYLKKTQILCGFPSEVHSHPSFVDILVQGVEK